MTLNPSFSNNSDVVVIIKKDGYSTLVSKCPCQGLVYAISPTMSNLDRVRLVLNWGLFPADLDSHLWYGNEHIYYAYRSGNNSDLDMDDTDRYGLETITTEERDFN